MLSSGYLILIISIPLSALGISNAASVDNKGSKSFPCPDAEAISPCICYESTSGLELNCDGVTSDSSLSAVFQAEFPVKNFYKLQIEDTSGITQLGPDLTTITFENVKIANVPTLRIVAEHFLRNNNDTLEVLDISGTSLSESGFSWYDVALLPKLHILFLMNNRFTAIHSFVSNSLESVSVAGNRLTHVEPGTFSNMPNAWTIDLYNNSLTRILPGTFDGASTVEWIWLHNNQITEILPGAFNGTDSLKGLYLDSNEISELYEGTLFIPSTMTELHISSNPIEILHPRALVWPETSIMTKFYLNANLIKEILPGSLTIVPTMTHFQLDRYSLETIYPGAIEIVSGTDEAPLETTLYNNQITTLDQDVYEDIFKRSTMVQLYGNDLTCGCDILWLISNILYMDRLHTSTTCSDGRTVHSLDPADLEPFC